MSNLISLLQNTVSRYPHKSAIIFGQQTITFTQLDEYSDRLACGLSEHGVRQGDRVAILLDNSPQFIISYFAIIKLGATVVPINHMFKEDEIGYVIRDAEVKVAITSAAYLRAVLHTQAQQPTLTVVLSTTKEREDVRSIYEWIYDPQKSLSAQYRADRDDIAVILYTSGTMGTPKGAMLSHGNLISNVESSRIAIAATVKDRVICILPLFHSFAATVCMLLPFSIGASMVVMKSMRPFRRTIRAIRKNRVTIFVGVPSLYHILNEIKLPRIVDSFLMHFLLPLRVCISGAAALPIPVWKKFQRRFRIKLLEGYGLTEASPVVSMNPYRGKNKGGSIGTPVPGVEVAIVDRADQPLGVGAVGELIVRGPNVMKGYLHREQETRETLKHGWLYTGDVAKEDKEGYLYIVGRKKDMVNVRGLNVYPREIEAVLCQHPAVKEAAVIGIPDYHKGEVPKGYVVCYSDTGVSERALIQYLKQRLANYKIPRTVEFRDSLPKNTTGKILKRELLREFHERSSGSSPLSSST